MKKSFITLLLIMGAAIQMAAMSNNAIRNHARFISDRMAYELDLTPMQYDDCYEINYDFIYSVERYMDDVVYGYGDAINNYYHLLDIRNEDLRYVLNSRQYARFISLDYFYRPIYSTGRNWSFRIYTIYSNRSFFYYDAPRQYKTYRGGHSAQAHYRSHYQHETHNGNIRIQGTDHFNTHSRNDFGTVRRDRNNKHQNSINNYRNPNQQNRTQDERYQDRSGNQNSPRINNRQNSSQQQPNRQGDKQQTGRQDSRQQQGGQNSRQQQGDQTRDGRR